MSADEDLVGSDLQLWKPPANPTVIQPHQPPSALPGLIGLVLAAGVGGYLAGHDLWNPPAPVEAVMIKAAASAVPIWPGTVWVNPDTKTYYRPGQRRFGTTYPGVFMMESQAVADGYWPSPQAD